MGEVNSADTDIPERDYTCRCC